MKCLKANKEEGGSGNVHGFDENLFRDSPRMRSSARRLAKRSCYLRGYRVAHYITTNVTTYSLLTLK